jgi:hypothetical protein
MNGLCLLGKEIVVARELEKLLTLFAEIWKGSRKLQYCNRKLHEVFSEKAALESDVRLELQRIIQCVCEENLRFKVVIFNGALSKPLYKRERNLWNDLKSI